MNVKEEAEGIAKKKAKNLCFLDNYILSSKPTVKLLIK